MVLKIILKPLAFILIFLSIFLLITGTFAKEALNNSSALEDGIINETKDQMINSEEFENEFNQMKEDCESIKDFCNSNNIPEGALETCNICNDLPEEKEEFFDYMMSLEKTKPITDEIKEIPEDISQIKEGKNPIELLKEKIKSAEGRYNKLIIISIVLFIIAIILLLVANLFGPFKTIFNVSAYSCVSALLSAFILKGVFIMLPEALAKSVAAQGNSQIVQESLTTLSKAWLETPAANAFGLGIFIAIFFGIIAIIFFFLKK